MCCLNHFAGSFSVDQHMDVIGQVADVSNPFLLSLEVIDTIMVKFNAAALQSRSQPGRTPVFNQGRLYAQKINQSLIFI